YGDWHGRRFRSIFGHMPANPAPATPQLDPFYIETGGQTWRVHDCVWRDRRWHRLSLGSRQATRRVFVSADGIKRVADITEDRGLDEEGLHRQLALAAYLPTLPPHVPPRDPR